MHVRIYVLRSVRTIWKVEKSPVICFVILKKIRSLKTSRLYFNTLIYRCTNSQKVSKSHYTVLLHKIKFLDGFRGIGLFLNLCLFCLTSIGYLLSLLVWVSSGNNTNVRWHHCGSGSSSFTSGRANISLSA